MLGSGIQQRREGSYKISVDGREASISAGVPEISEYSDDMIYRNPADFFRLSMGRVIPSLSLVRFGKVKPFIDGVYATAERTIGSGDGRISRPGFVKDLVEELKDSFAAHYVRTIAEIPEEENILFDREKVLSVVQGFYDWNNELRRAWRQIKASSQRPSFFVRFPGMDDDSIDVRAMDEINRVLGENPELRDKYEQIRRAYGLLTNKAYSRPSLFPTAILPDQELFKELSLESQSDLEEGLGKLLVKAVREGRIDFSPQEEDGLYIRQMHEITPLVRRNVPEFEKFLPNEKYGEILDGEFISQWAATRHTHVAHSEYMDMLITCSMPIETPLLVSPQLEVEPLATSYERMADTLGFLRRSVVSLFGEEFLEEQRFLQNGERSDRRIGEEFDGLESILGGLAAIARDSIHLTYDSGNGNERRVKDARNWIKNISSDMDIDRDIPIFVPIIRDSSGENFISYIDAGFRLVNLSVSYSGIPHVKVSPDRDVEFTNAEYKFPILVHKEVRIPKDELINDGKLRELLPEGRFSERDLDEAVRKLEREEALERSF